MMQLVNRSGAVLLERQRVGETSAKRLSSNGAQESSGMREKPHTQRTHTSTLHVRSLSKGMKKTVKPVLMSKEEFFTRQFPNLAF